MKENPELAARVANELLFDPALDARNVGFSASGGEVRLHGNVPSREQKHALVSAAGRVQGVTSVIDQLEIRPRDDPESAGP